MRLMSVRVAVCMSNMQGVVLWSLNLMVAKGIKGFVCGFVCRYAADVVV